MYHLCPPCRVSCTYISGVMPAHARRFTRRTQCRRCAASCSRVRGVVCSLIRRHTHQRMWMHVLPNVRRRIGRHVVRAAFQAMPGGATFCCSAPGSDPFVPIRYKVRSRLQATKRRNASLFGAAGVRPICAYKVPISCKVLSRLHVSYGCGGGSAGVSACGTPPRPYMESYNGAVYITAACI